MAVEKNAAEEVAHAERLGAEAEAEAAKEKAKGKKKKKGDANGDDAPLPPARIVVVLEEQVIKPVAELREQVDEVLATVEAPLIPDEPAMPEPTFVQLVTRPPQRNTQTPSALFAILTAKEKDSDPDAEPPAEPTRYGTRDMELVFQKAYTAADGADPADDGVTRAPYPPAEPDDPPPDPGELTIRSVCPDAEIVLNSLPEEIATQIREAFDGGDEWWETVGKPKFVEAFEKMKELDPMCADP